MNDGAGEIVLNSIDTDGVKQGFDLEMLDALAARVHVPIIASGGAGNRGALRGAVYPPRHRRRPGGLHLPHRRVDIKELKRFLRARGVEMRL